MTQYREVSFIICSALLRAGVLWQDSLSDTVSGPEMKSQRYAQNDRNVLKALKPISSPVQLITSVRHVMYRSPPCARTSCSSWSCSSPPRLTLLLFSFLFGLCHPPSSVSSSLRSCVCYIGSVTALGGFSPPRSLSFSLQMHFLFPYFTLICFNSFFNLSLFI